MWILTMILVSIHQNLSVAFISHHKTTHIWHVKLVSISITVFHKGLTGSIVFPVCQVIFDKFSLVINSSLHYPYNIVDIIMAVVTNLTKSFHCKISYQYMGTYKHNSLFNYFSRVILFPIKYKLPCIYSSINTCWLHCSNSNPLC